MRICRFATNLTILLKKDAFGDDIYIDGDILRLDRELANLRGQISILGSSSVWLATRGDYTHSRVDTTALDSILDVARVGPYHDAICEIATNTVVDPKCTVATDLARRCGLLGNLLREVGLDRAGKFCDLIRAAHDFSRGVDTDGNAV